MAQSEITKPTAMPQSKAPWQSLHGVRHTFLTDESEQSAKESAKAYQVHQQNFYNLTDEDSNKISYLHNTPSLLVEKGGTIIWSSMYIIICILYIQCKTSNVLM